MKIRNRLLLSILPPIIALFVISGIISFTVSRSGLYGIERDFLKFKAQLLQNHVNSQWNLLVDFSLFTDPSYLETAQLSILEFAKSIIKPAESEDDESPQVIFAATEIDSLRSVTLITDPTINIARSDLDVVFERAQEVAENTQFATATINGVEYAYTFFYFEPFQWTFFVAERVDVFTLPAQIVQRVLIISVVVSIIILFFIVLILSQSLTRPLSQMASTAKRVVKDTLNMDVEIPYLYNDEAGTLALTFNSMFKELDTTYGNLKKYAFESAVSQRQEKRIRTVFQKYVPQDLINRFIKNPDSLLVGENRDVAVLFSDIRSFTTISETMKPDELVRFLNRYLEGVISSITAVEGVVDKFIGDAVMALFGAPAAHDDDAARSVKVALHMLEIVDALNARAAQDKVTQFSIGIGINYGTVTVGNIGSDKKVEYTAIGDAVNLASRLEGLCKRYSQSLIISQSVAKEVKDTHALRFVDKIIVKGKTTSTNIFTIEKSATKALEDYNSGVARYYRKDFTAAHQSLKRAAATLDDSLTQQFLTRCQECINNPPPKDWDGAIKLDSK